ncbi:MAG: hypothetical protein ACO3IV_03495 [Ilumatobacteraceae bacterium]
MNDDTAHGNTARSVQVGTRIGDTLAVWAVRTTWILAALTTQSSSLAWWAGWGAVAIGAIVLHPVSLSVVRVVAPLVAVETILIIGTDRVVSADWRHVAVAGAVAASIVVAFSGDYGRAHVQAAAYGAERRHLLRPPMSVLAVSVVAWLVAAGTLVVASFVDDSRIDAGLQILGALVAAGLAFRAVALARRWFVVVPAGVVLHDPLLLTDSVMIPRRDVTSLAVDTAGGALDVTGTTWGPTVVVTAREPHDVSLTDFGARLTRTGRRLHAGAVRFAPSRPGAAIDDARL